MYMITVLMQPQWIQSFLAKESIQYSIFQQVIIQYITMKASCV